MTRWITLVWLCSLSLAASGGAWWWWLGLVLAVIATVGCIAVVAYTVGEATTQPVTTAEVAEGEGVSEG